MCITSPSNFTSSSKRYQLVPPGSENLINKGHVTKLRQLNQMGCSRLSGIKLLKTTKVVKLLFSCKVVKVVKLLKSFG